MPFSTWEPNLAPPWMVSGVGSAWYAQRGAVRDAWVARLKQAVKARFPLLAPADALFQLGLERSIDKGPQDTNSSWASNLQQAWDIWSHAGTALGLLLAFKRSGYTATVKQRNGYSFTLDGSNNLVATALPAGGWQPDANPSFWSVFTLIVDHAYPVNWLTNGWQATVLAGVDTGTISASGIPATDYEVVIKIVTTGSAGGAAQYQFSSDGERTAYSSTNNLPSGAFGIGGITGVTFTATGHFTAGEKYWMSLSVPNNSSTDAIFARSILRRWQPAHSTCARIIIRQTGQLWGYPTSTWGVSGKTWGGASTTVWTP